MLAGLARSDRDDRARGANKKNLQNSVQCVEGDTVGVISELCMDGGEKKHSMDSGEEYDGDKEKHSTGLGEEKNGDLLIEEVYLYITSSTCPEGCPDSRKRVIRKKSKKFQVSEGEL